MNKYFEIELFNDINIETKAKLMEISRVKSFKKNTHIFYDKDIVENIYIAYSGKVSLYKMSEFAQKKVIFILGENTIINADVIDDMPASVNCEVFEDAMIIMVDKYKFIELMKQDFELTTIILKSMALKTRRLYRQMKNSPLKVEKKVAARLWKLSKDYGISCEDGILINLNISITYLADMFGMPRETVSRALKILYTEDLILYKNKRFIVKDSKKLSDFFKGK